MESKAKVYSEKEVVELQKSRYILPGNDHFVGSDDKRHNKKIIHVELPYTLGNYSLFYKGTQLILEQASAAIVELLNNDYVLSVRRKNELYNVLIDSLHVVHHTSTKDNKSKLNGINSLSTSCVDNSFCCERMKKTDCICSHCYANTQQKQQLALQDRNIINGVILRNIVIPEAAWKKYFSRLDLSKFFRIESFGDVQNKTQAINYINFMNAFPRVHFAVWTKNPGIWYFAMQEAGKPQNMSYIISSDKVNVQNTHTEKTFGNIDHVFTVYEKKYAKKNGINITCGGRECMSDCIKKHKGCYFRDTEKVINEKLK